LTNPDSRESAAHEKFVGISDRRLRTRNRPGNVFMGDIKLCETAPNLEHKKAPFLISSGEGA
jgi:hypothetical protein